MSLKRLVLRSPLSSIAVDARERIALLGAAYRRSEELGMTSNDQLASTLVARLGPADAVFVDVGAHLGTVVEAVLRRGDRRRVVAIEAVAEKAAFLRKRFPSIEVHHCAAGECECEVSFFVDVRRSAYSSLGRPLPGREVHEVHVAMRPLDAVLQDERVGMIKIDVEGAELGVLRGARRLIEAHRPVIMFESGPLAEDGLGYSKEALYAWLDDAGYDIVVPNRVAHAGTPLSCDGFLESHQHPRRTTNYFAIPREQRVLVRDRARAVLGFD
ncbi:MAG: FkbM family methyltransferase [Polyangiales bacterium]